MRRLSLHIFVALLTFTIGLLSASIMHFQRQQVSQKIDAADEKTVKIEDEQKADPSEDCDPSFVGLYSNYDYAYRVQIPKGMIGYGSCYTNHGFGINLSDPAGQDWVMDPGDDSSPQAYLFVDASYNSAEWKSLDEAMKVYIPTPEEYGDTNIKIESRTATRLGGLRAVRYVVRYYRHREARVDEKVLAIRRDGEIVYTIGISSPAARYESDKKVLTEMQKSLRLQPLPSP